MYTWYVFIFKSIIYLFIYILVSISSFLYVLYPPKTSSIPHLLGIMTSGSLPDMKDDLRIFYLYSLFSSPLYRARRSPGTWSLHPPPVCTRPRICSPLRQGSYPDEQWSQPPQVLSSLQKTICPLLCPVRQNLRRELPCCKPSRNKFHHPAICPSHAKDRWVQRGTIQSVPRADQQTPGDNWR